MELDMAGFGPRLRRRRLAAGLSEYQLGKRAGMSVSHVQRLEAGEAGGVGLAVLVRLAAGVRVGVEDLLRDLGVAVGLPGSGELWDVVGELSGRERKILTGVGRVLIAERESEGGWEQPVAAYDRDVPRPE